MAKSAYELYRERTEAVIRDTLDEFVCQPIFFVGTGFSKRYFQGPTWNKLLHAVARHIGLSDADFDYIRQKSNQNPIQIGDSLSERAFEWAWGPGKEAFPKEYFKGDVDKSIFLKHIACMMISKETPSPIDISKSKFTSEIEKLLTTKPHAIITTNYDNILADLFQDYEQVIGESVIKRDMNLVGEIFQIHGSIQDPSSIVLTGRDYEEYREKKKYISAKLLTYLAEHPVFIFGYGLGDPNVTGIIQDVGYILAADNLIRNIFYVEWRPDAESLADLRQEYVLGSGDMQYRVRSIVTNDFSWIYKIIAQQKPLQWVNPKLIRALSARFYKLIRSDIPKNGVEIDFDHLTSVAESEDVLPKLLGISHSESPNVSYPLSLTQVAEHFGYKSWNEIDKLLKKIKSEKGGDIKASDNRYHYAMAGKSINRRYSKELLPILSKIIGGEEYELNL